MFRTVAESEVLAPVTFTQCWPVRSDIYCRSAWRVNVRFFLPCVPSPLPLHGSNSRRRGARGVWQGGGPRRHGGYGGARAGRAE